MRNICVFIQSSGSCLKDSGIKEINKLVHVYTGDGKGKTTAALGLALRVAGTGAKVYIGQFLKGRYCSELASLKKIKNIKIEQFGRACFIKSRPEEKDIQLANAGLKAAQKAVFSQRYALVILDEMCVALNLKLISLQDILNLITNVPKDIDVVLTGRCAHPDILKQADLVSEIKERKHYYQQGVKARRGIEF